MLNPHQEEGRESCFPRDPFERCNISPIACSTLAPSCYTCALVHFKFKPFRFLSPPPPSTITAMQRVDRADIWKNKARFLQMKLRDRFRITVDRHCRRHQIFIPDGYFSSTLQRCLRRFRDFRHKSLPSSSFYRKTGMQSL